MTRALAVCVPLACALIAACLPTSAHAQVDPDTARRKYAECRALADADDPCAALKACDDGLRALSTDSLQRLRDEVAGQCRVLREERQRQRKLRRDCDEPGQVRTLENDAECCWPGQRWDGQRCRDQPSSCPDGYEIAGERCALRPCEGGREHVEGPHCCWPSQVWAESQQRCVGVPQCPDGLEPKGEECFPIIPDRDVDGVPDAADACPDAQEDLDGFEDNDGCPDPDDDGDGVCDPIIASWGKNDGTFSCRGADTCPAQIEDLDGFEDNDGCPDLDNDRDDVADVDDRCPDLAGPVDHQGCPPPPDLTLIQAGWGSVGGGFLLLGVGLGLQLRADALRADITDAQPNDQGLISAFSESEARAIEDEADITSAVGITSMAVGGGLMITGVVLLILDAQRDGDDDDNPGLSLGLSSGGASFSWRF